MACSSTRRSTDPCPAKNNCVACPDFVIRRHDTRPAFKVRVEDCDGPLDLTDLVLEASMWATAKLKAAIMGTDDYFRLADDIGFDQIMVGDVIVTDRVRRPEHMLVTGFDETNYLVRVERGYRGTQPQAWKKGTGLKIMKFEGAEAETEMLYQDILQLDGTTAEDQLTDSFLIYNWGGNDTCLPGCYYLEFKLLKMADAVESVSVQAVEPSFTDPDFTPADFACGLPDGVEWVRRFPVNHGFIIQVTDSPTAEL